MEALAKREGQPLIQDSNILMEWRPNQPFDEYDEYDDDYEPSIDDGEDYIELETDDVSEPVDDGDSVTGILSQSDLPITEPVPEQVTQPQFADVATNALVEDETNLGEENVTCIAEEEELVHVEEEGAVHVEEEGAVHVEEEGASAINETENSEGTTPNEAYNLRPNRSRGHSHRFDPQVYNVNNMHVPQAPKEPATLTQRMFGFVFTQMTAQAGIKKHGQAARDTFTAEFAQLDYKGAYELIHATDLTETQQTSALQIISLIKEKWNGQLKGRLVADGRPQRALYAKDKTSSPTAAPESVLLTAMIDAVEDQHMVVVDITGAYLNADMDDFVLIRLSGDDVDMIFLALVFLASRVSKATQQGQTTLKRLLEYRYGTYNLPIILGADDLHTMYTFVDASYAVHDDMKSHTGGVITFGRGGIACKSTKQKLVTNSSTEAKLVGASEYLP